MSSSEKAITNHSSTIIEHVKMKIAVVTMVYNEAMLLPYFLRHYSYLDEIHVLYETDSTDESLEILTQAPNVVIEKCHIDGGLDDIEKIRIINQAVQNIAADWVYVVDPDEFIFPTNNESPYSFLQRQVCNVVRSGMFQIYRHRGDKDLDPSLPPILQRMHGDPNLFSIEMQTNRAANSVYIKPNIVRPSKKLKFYPGHHHIEGNPVPSHELYLGVHWQMADPTIAIARRMARKERISERNKANQMGWQHFAITVDKIKDECERHLDDPIIDELCLFGEVSQPHHPFDTHGKDLVAQEQALFVSDIPSDTLHKGNNMYKFNILDHPICLSLPRRIVPFPSWRQHIPFAMLLIDILKPRTLVELGVHYGDSYCAFCQAIVELQRRTTCYGVDTWQGDPHASFYGPEVLADLKAHHDPLYGGFSYLIQSTFDDALQHFPDGSIDILHIDGYHTYEAVKHDFETWLPNMSSRGVVLFHDIAEKQGDFGVWKLWEELKAKYPHFEFIHGHGLGLIAVGERPPVELNWLLEADDKATVAIQNLFFCLGSRLTDKISPQLGHELSALPFSGGTGDWLGARIKLEDLRSAQIELETIRSSIFFQLAWKLRSIVNTTLPLDIRRLLGRILTYMRTGFAHRKQLSVLEPIDKRTEFARKYLRGVGLIVSPLDPNLRVSPNVSMDFADASDYDVLPKLRMSERWQASGADARLVKLAEVSDEAYDFVIYEKLSENLSNPIEALRNWLRVVKTGGILFLVTSTEDILSKCLLDLQYESKGVKILDSATNLADGNNDKIYIIEKVNYLSKITNILQNYPSLETEYTIDVVVPIYNAYDDVEKCLCSLFNYQDVYRIILINDCSTDQRIKELLDTLQKNQCERFRVIENKKNLGYLKTANIGMKVTKNDVILLNSDTIVTPGWAKKIRACAYSRHCIATVTPFSNNGVECSIPEPGQENEIPTGYTIESFAELVENCSFNRYPELVTAVGFCMYIRRAVIDEIGYLDEENFGLGYGEENDFSMRASRKGYKNVLCDNTFVFHKGGSSFSHRRNALIQKSAMVLDRMYPDFWPAMHLFWRTKPLAELHNSVRRELGL